MVTSKKKTAVKKVVKPQTTEEKVLGETPAVETYTERDYEAPEALYKITNLQVKNKPVTVDGTVVETFIGNKNREARAELKKGAKTVYTKDMNGERIYKIEVIK